LYGHFAESEKKDGLPPAGEAKVALAAYSLLGVDAGWLSPKADRWFRTGAGGIPGGFTLVGAKTVSRVIPTPAGDIGLVFFPQAATPGKAPSQEQEQAALAAGKALRKRCALVLGVSPWGYMGERNFLPKAIGVYGVILGGGEGVGFGFAVPADAKEILWLRPDSQGRAINRLDLLTLPKQGEALRWTKGNTFEADLEFLDDAVPSDPAMATIVGKPSE
jgi:hypothetical protein